MSTIVDTTGVTQQDALTIRDNAEREAWMARVQAANATAQANMLAQAGANTRVSPFTGFDTLLTGASTAFDRFARWRRESAVASGGGGSKVQVGGLY